MTSLCDAQVIRDLLWHSLEGGHYDLPTLQASLQEESDFAAMGIDSLDLVEFYLRLREHFNIDLNEYDFAKLTSVRAVTTFLNAKLVP